MTIASERTLFLADGSTVCLKVKKGEKLAFIGLASPSCIADNTFTEILHLDAKDLKILASALYDVRSDVQMNDPEHKDEF